VEVLPDWISAGASAVAAVVSVVAVFGLFDVRRQLGLQRQQLHRDLENLYVARYWTIMDKIAECELLTASDAVAPRRIAIRSYLRLSEHECDLRAADRVTDAKGCPE